MIRQSIFALQIVKDGHNNAHVNIKTKQALETLTHIQNFTCSNIRCPSYCIMEKFGKFGESSAIRQTKTIQSSSYN